MKQPLRLWALLALLALPWAVSAQSNTLTICNGTANHEYVPFYGYYADDDQHNQMIYPSDSLTAMNGSAITRMVFYIDPTGQNGSYTAADRLGTWTVSLGETTATTLNGLDATTTLTEVYEGYFDCSTGLLTLEFETPYLYNGGNLLVDLQHSEASYNRWYFLGVSATGASYCYDSQRDFLPKVQFTYGNPPTCFRVQSIAASDILSDGMTINWVDTVNTSTTYTLTYYAIGSTDTTEVSGISGTSYVLTSLDAATAYEVRVTPDCSDDILPRTGTFMTDCEGGSCMVTVNAVDTYGDGWNGNAINVMQNGVLVGSATIASGSAATAQFQVCKGAPVSLTFTKGDYPGEMAGTVVDGSGAVVFTIENMGNYSSGATLVTLNEPCPDCIAPTGLAAAVDENGDFVFSWTGTASAYMVYVNDSLYSEGVSDTSYVLNGLISGSSYRLGVAALCDDDTSAVSWINVFTPCAAITALPWSENFNSLPTGYNSEFHPCLIKGNNADVNYPYVYNSSSFGIPSNFLYFYSSIYSSSTGDVKEWVVLPTVGEDVAMNTLELSFTGYPCYPNSYYGHSLLVGVIDSAAYVDSMAIDTIATFVISEEGTKYVSFANYTGTGKNIILMHWLDGDHTYAYLGIDDLDLHELPQCDRPDSLTLTAAGSTSLSLGWWASDDVSDFLVEYRPSDAVTYSSATASTNSITLDNLTSNTVYDIRLRSVCGSDYSTAITGQFRTACANVTTYPYTEDVESDSRNCWMAYSYDNATSSDWALNTYTVHSGSNAFYSSYSDGVGTDWLVSPAFEIPADMEGARLSWYIAGGVYQSEIPRYAVKVSTTSSVDTTAFTTLLVENRDDYDNNTYTYVFEKRSVSLAQYAGQTVYIAFVRHARDDNSLYLDDITIDQAQVPEAAIVGSTTPLVGVTQTYAARLDGGVDAGLTWSWYSARANANTATMTAVSADTITMLYSTPGVDTLRLIATNTYGADTVWMAVEPIDITYASLPYSTGFEPADDRSWTISNGPNGWYIDSSVSASGDYSLYVSADSGATNGYINSTSSNSYAYKAFNFATAGQYGISLDWSGTGESCCDYIQVYLVPVSDSNMVGSSSTSSFSTPSGWRTIGSRMNMSATWQNAATTFELDNPGVYYVCIFWHNDGSVGSNPAGAVDNIMLTPITCPAPVALTIDSVGSDAAKFHWTPTGTETAWQVCVGSLAPVTVTDTFYAVTGLAPATSYSVSVRGICGAGDTSLVLGGSFWTECVAFSVPYYFHHAAGNGLNQCWSDVVTATSQPGTTWAQSANYSNEYIYSYASYGTSIANDYLISPAIQIPATGDLSSLRLVLQMAGLPSTSSASSLASYQVLVSPTGADSVAAFTDVLSTDTINSGTFAYYRYSLANYAGQTIRFAVRNMSKMYGQVGLYDAAVRFVNQPMYTVYGSNIALTGDTNSYTAEYGEGDTATMTLSWTSAMAAAGQATILNANTDSMSIIYSTPGVDSITFIATNSYGADTVAFHVTVYSCGTISSFPYTEPFEVDNPCWLPVYADGNPSVNTMMVTNEISNYSGINAPHGGSKAFRFSSYSNSTDYNQYLVSPELNGSDMTLSFWAASYGTSDHLWIGFSSASRDTADFVWDTTEVALLSTDWTEYTYTLPAGTKYVAFHYYGNYAFYVYLDDLTITGGSGCLVPEITSVSAEETTVTVNYMSESDDVEVAIVAGAWTAPTTGTLVANDTTFTFTGLTAETQYTVGVRAVCGTGSYSEWDTIAVTTDMHPCFVPTNVTMSNVTYSSATLSWTPGENETAWEVRLYSASPLDSAHYQVSDNPTLDVDGLLVGASYAVTVRALCTDTYYSDWSEPVMLNTQICAVPTNIAVGNVSATGATVTWQGTAATYVVNYGTQGINQGEGHLDTVQGTSYTISNLAPQTPYDVYVRSICADGVSSDWSAVAQFTTTQVGIDDVNANANISLYPNPASHMVTISGIEGTATVTVIDLNGRQIGQWRVENGEQTIDVSTMAKGAYFVRIAGESTVAVRKLVVK